MMNFTFGMQINIKVFLKLILSFWLCITRHAQSTQNKCISLQYLQKSMGYETDFLPADKHKHFLQIDRTTLDVHD